MTLKRLAVLGAGNGGRAIAADMTLAGFEVNLFELPEFAEGFKTIHETKEIKITGVSRQGTAKLRCATHDIEEAIEGADMILVVTPAFGHERMAEVAGPYLKEGQTVALVPGGFGSWVFYKTLKEKGLWKDMRIADAATLPYGARNQGPNEVAVHINAILIPVGVFPAKHTEEVVEMLNQLYPVFKPVEDILDAGLLNVNPSTHPAPSILSTSKIESGDFYLYRDGMTPSTRKVMVAVDRERIAVREALGYKPPHYALDPDTYEVFEDYFGTGGIKSGGYKMRGPLSVKDRYITEDTPYGLVLWSSLGKRLGVPTPACDAIITLASIVNDSDYFKEGATLDNLGLKDVDMDSLKRFLKEGEW